MALAQFGVVPTWLTELTDAARLRTALGAAIPEARSGTLEILDCRPARLRLKNGSWVGRYDATVRSGAADPHVVRLRATTLPAGARVVGGPPVADFGTPDWQGQLPELRLMLQTEPADAALPALPVLTDPDAARELLETSIRDAGPGYADFTLRSCIPEIMRYKPGSRCTVRYQLDYPEGLARPDWPRVVVAKTYHGDKGQVAWTGMRELWHSPMAESGVAIAEPLAFLPELNVLVQGPIAEETTLKEAIRRALATGGSEEVTRAVRASAAGLAALHSCGVRHGELVTWEDELAEVRGVIARIASQVPELDGAADPVLDRLVAVAAGHPADPARPAHRSFRPAQVLLAGGGLGFIDFDGFCQAEPALDIALFRTTVQQLGSRPEHDRPLADLAEAFLDEYARHAPVSPVRVALWEALDLITRVLHCWTKVKPEKLPDALAALERQLAAAPLAVEV